MKATSIVILLLLGITSCTSQSKEANILKGQIRNEEAGTKVFLEEITYSSRTALDTSELDRQGDFSFKTSIVNNGLYQIRIGEQKAIFLVLNERPSTVTLNADSSSIQNFSYTVKGSPESEQLRKFIVEVKKHGEAFGNSMNEYKKMVNDSTPDSVRNVYAAKVMTADSTFKSFARTYVDTVKNLVIAIFAVTNLNPDQDQAVFIKLEEKVKKEYPNLPFVQSYLAMLNDQRQSASQQGYGSKFSIGMEAPEIVMNDINNKPVKLSSLRGKYVLLDFWASWCGPCRAENPNLVSAYQKFNEKGFTVYSVSLDTDRDRWIKAIQKDRLEWPYHVSELKGWQSPICQTYGISSIPASYLLDEEGKIVAVNLRGPELHSKLAQILE